MINLTYNKYVFAMILLMTSWATQAHFVVYEEWYNPATGQILEEYFDIHNAKKEHADSEKQFQEFIDRLIPYKDHIFAITEDAPSFIFGNNFSKLMRKDFAELPSQAFVELGEIVPSSKAVPQSSIVPPEANSGLPLSYIRLRAQDIPTINAEVRENGADGVPVVVKDDTVTYDDGSVLKSFYARVQEARKMSETTGTELDRYLYAGSVVDAYILHAIATNSHKHIVLCAGIFHCLSVNNILSQLGWRRVRTVLPTSLTEEQRAVIIPAIIRESVEDPLTLKTHFLLHGLKDVINILNSATLPNIREIPITKIYDSSRSAVISFIERRYNK